MKVDPVEFVEELNTSALIPDAWMRQALKLAKWYQASANHEVIRGWYLPEQYAENDDGQWEGCSISGCRNRGQIQWLYKDGYEHGAWLCGKHGFEVAKRWLKNQSE